MRTSHDAGTKELCIIIELEKLRYKEALDRNEPEAIIVSILNHIQFLENQLLALKPPDN
ncbi:MAG: hypothetical protein WDO19_22040 [Bacteroidota bacterium]